MSTTGGAAMFTGANFQADIAAFFAIVALSEDLTALPPDVAVAQAPRTPPTRIGSELNLATDDVAVWFDTSAAWFTQAKATLDSSDAATSDYAGVLDQFVRQWAHGRDTAAGVPLLPADRFLLVLGEGASGRLRDDLRILLERIPTLAAGEALTIAAQGQPRIQEALDRVAAHVRRSLEASGKATDDDTVRSVLLHARVWATNQDALLQVARTLLSAFVVADNAQVGAALALLQRYFADAAQRRSAHDVLTLRAILVNAGIVLKELRSIAGDVARIRDETVAVIRTETRFLKTREGEIRITREILPELFGAVRRGDLIVTGEAGAGKTDVMTQAAHALLQAGNRVVYIDAADSRMADPTHALHLDLTLEVVLERWGDAGEIGYLFIDGFDSTRIGPSLEVLVRVIRRLQRQAERRWRVVIASREYDLLHAGVLADLFPFDARQPVGADHRDTRFDRYAHIVLPRLTPAEIDGAAVDSPSLQSLLAGASPTLRALLDNPFNLSIAASFTVGSEAVPDLSQVRSQSELLNVWWNRSVLIGKQSQTKERALRDLAREMVQSRRLRLPKERLPDNIGADELLSASVLGIVGVRHESVAFTHAIVFDYAVDHLLLEHEGALAVLLAEDRDSFLFMLPAIQMRFDDLWTHDRSRFFRELAALFATSTQRRTLLMIVGRIIYDRFESVDDLLPLLDSPDASTDDAVRFLVRTLIYEREQHRRLTAAQRPKWVDLALELSRRLPRFEHDTLLLVSEVLEKDA